MSLCWMNRWSVWIHIINIFSKSVAEEVADRIGIVHMGKLVAVGTEEELHNLGGEGNAELEATFLALTREESDVAVQRQLHQG